MIRTLLLAFCLFLMPLLPGRGYGQLRMAERELPVVPRMFAGFVPPEPVIALPDTMYASARLFSFEVELCDTTCSGELKSLSDLYDSVDGILTFRGSPFRDARYGGKVKGRPVRVVKVWSFTTGFDRRESDYGSWGGGSGWTGQPLHVRWPDSLCDRMRALSPALTPDFSNEEIIVGSLCGEVYFIDYASGRASRQPLPAENPIKGTVSLDPRLNGNLYVGQGIPCTDRFGALTFDLFRHRETSFFGRDPRAWRGWGAYDSSAVAVDGFVIRPGENGSIYKLSCGEGGATKLHSVLRYRDGRRRAPGIESSMAVCRNYGYVADNAGNILCVNLHTMRPVWAYDNRDDTDATPVLELERKRPVLYTACEVDKQGDEGCSHMVKLDGLTGRLIWEQAVPCRKFPYAGKVREGGMFATPLLGGGNCSDLIVSNFCGTSDRLRGEMIAFDKRSGRIVYRTPLACYSWSSPVAFYNEADEMFILTGDVLGNVYLIEGRTGEVLFTEKIGANFESSPIVVGDCAVIGSRGNEIYKLRVE